MIPGSNLLDMAFSVIAQQTVVYYKYLERILNNIGQEVTAYNTPQVVTGSFQPVPRNLYQAYGLDLQKSYFTFYVSKDVIDVARGVSGDQLVFNSLRYQCESNVEWFNIDGWVGVLCVLIGEVTEQPIFGFGVNLESNGNLNYDNGSFKVGT